MKQVSRLPAWRRYEARTRAFFESLALPECKIEKTKFTGARGRHEVDVLVMFRRFGVEHRWVIECKHHRSKITKAMVLTLIGVVEDVGADRGFLLSEVGFQPGATDVARLRNITLTSLTELRKGAAIDIIDGKVASLHQRFALAQVGLLDRMRVLRDPEPNTGARFVSGAPGHGEVHVLGIVAMCEHALKVGIAGQFPIRYPDPAAVRNVGRDDVKRTAVARNWSSLIKGLDELMSAVEVWVAALPTPKRVSGVLVALSESLANVRGPT